MISKQIRPGLWYLGALDESLRTFGSVSFTETGMMYNSYLMSAGDAFILFGTLPARYTRLWLAEIKRIIGKHGLGWAILFGTDHDRAAVRLLLEEFPEIILIGGTNALYQLEGFVEAEYRSIEIRTDRCLTLGGRKLAFRVLADKVVTPPLYVLEPESGVLVTADAFGSLYASDRILASEIGDQEAYLRGAVGYCADLFGEKRKKTMEAAAALVRENGVTLICPACGPVADWNLERLLAIFQPGAEAKSAQLTVAVIHAAGNYVRELADCIGAGIRKSGAVAVTMLDLSAVSRHEVLKRASQADAFLFGTPETGGDAAKAVWDIVTSLRRENCLGKPAAVFTSTNSLGSAAEHLRQRLAQLGCDLHLQDYLVQGKPDSQTLKNAWEYGFGVGCSLQKIPNPHKPKFVKCLVCGEIFDASLGTCPVCGVGLEQCVPVEEDAVTFRKDTGNRYVILGGGIAAVSAAEAIRQRDKTGSILLLSAENYLPINRPMLTKNLKTVSEGSETLFVHGWEWYDERKIDLRLGCRVIALNPQAKTVTADSGETIPYDKLIYATGAECFVPPFEGHDKAGVLTIRHLWDSQELQKRMDSGANKAVVIGGGVLGLEAASELMRAGIQTTVLEATPQIIGRQVDAATAAILKNAMEAMQVSCYEGVSIAGIEGEHQATGVRLGDGRVFPADIVIVSCGNRANVQAAKEAGITVERAIVVNQRMETSAADVYACGDCAQFDGVNFQLWQEASNQGRVAGANAAGEPLAYANQLLGLNLEGFGTSLYAIGDPGKKSDVPYQTVEICDSVINRHEKYWFYGGSLQGAVLIGAPGKTAEIAQAVTEHARYDALF